MTVNPNYYVEVYERAVHFNAVRCLLGDGVPTPTDGGGGYQVIGLPMRAPVTVWQGRPAPVTLTLPLRLVDGLAQPGGVAAASGMGGTRATGGVRAIPRFHAHAVHQAADTPDTLAGQMRVLINMWRPSDQTVAPPVVKLKATHSLVPFAGMNYVISDMQWGAAQANENGYRVMQDITLVLLEYREDEQLQAIQAKSSSSAAHRTVYTVKQGDTLTAIATRFHIKGGWKALGAEQHPPITDPRKIKVGEKLSIPAEQGAKTE